METAYKTKLAPVGDNSKVGANLFTYKMTSKVKLNNRNAFKIINALRNFTGAVYIEKTSEQRRANAKSLLGLLSLSVVDGDEINIVIGDANDDVEKLFDEIRSVFENK